VQVVGVSYDSEKVLSAFAAKSKVTFPLLSDTDSKTIKAYGLLDRQASGKRFEGMALPATVVIDKKGVVRATLMLEGYRKRHTTDDLIEAAKKAE
jgi:peroxiredoxin Q/BCP